jgi:hypothetical protein
VIPSAELRLGRGEAYELVAFDLRHPGSLKCLFSEGAAWRGSAHIELLDPHHAVLVVRAGGASVREGRAASSVPLRVTLFFDIVLTLVDLVEAA